jgi:hypothetical protein
MGTFIQGPPVDWSCSLVVRERADKEEFSSQVRRQDAWACYLVVRERTEDAVKELQGWEVRWAFDYVV